MSVGGNCQKYHERGWNRTEGWGHKDLKRGRQAGSRGGFLKKGEGWNPLINCVMVIPKTKIGCVRLSLESV